MKKVITLFSLMLLVSFSFGLYAQTAIKGIVVDANSGESLPGASVMIKGTTQGTVTGVDGAFNLNVNSQGNVTVLVSFVGYLLNEQNVSLSSGQTKDLGTIKMESDAIGIDEVLILADVAIDRQTPVAVSTIKPELISEKLGTQEFPEILKSTPGVYATKGGGAFGDGRVNLRGFDSRNVGVMINGVPVNDMENGRVYWSNWAGLSDVTRSMQVQRGLGAAKVAIPSVGGTINILTNTTDAKAGGNVFYGLGNDGYAKFGTNLSSGLTENGWATSMALARTTGDGYVDGTQFEAYSYFFNLSKSLNTKHRLAFSVFGAPQWHGQRSTSMPIESYQENERGIRYNSDWGYKNGQVMYVRRNYYHKPQAIFNHFWTVSDKFDVSTALYASTGTGGGWGSYGVSKFYDKDYIRNGVINFDKIVDENIAAGALGSESIIRTSVNNHAWYGALSNARYHTGSITLSGGIDLRYYKGEHYREVVDLLGGQFYIDNSDMNNPNKAAKVGDIIAYYNDGEVMWEGLFAQAEYKEGPLSAFAAGAVSNKAYRRTDYFQYLPENQATPWVSFVGFSGKGGANYNLTGIHNVFVNAGYFENQPGFDAVFLNFANNINEEAANEIVYSFEAGYGLRSTILAANLNAYYTYWGNRTFTRSEQIAEGTYIYANILGVDALHTGVEMDFTFRPVQGMDITGMLSIGDWRWANDVTDVQMMDEDQNPIGSPINVYIADVHVADAAQTTAALGFNYRLFAGLKFGVDYNYYDRLFAQFEPTSRGMSDGENPDSWQIPGYQLIDMNLGYSFEIGDYKGYLNGNVNNLLDTHYISDAYDGSAHNWQGARVYYGWGRSWSINLKIKF